MNGTEVHRSVRGRILPFPQERSESLTVVPPNARSGDELIFYTVLVPLGNELIEGDVLIARANFELEEIGENTMLLIDDGREILARRVRDMRDAKVKAVNKLPPPPPELFQHWHVLGLILAVVRTL